MKNTDPDPLGLANYLRTPVPAVHPEFKTFSINFVTSNNLLQVLSPYYVYMTFWITGVLVSCSICFSLSVLYRNLIIYVS